MHSVKEQKRDRILSLARDAITRVEIEAADAAITEYLNHYPQEKGRDLVHGFLHKRDQAARRASQAKALNLSTSEDAERESLLRRVVLAGWRRFESEELLEAASGEVKSWAARFPTDPLTADLQMLIAQWLRDAEMTEAAMRQLLEDNEVLSQS
jgi:hypothetical protein